MDKLRKLLEAQERGNYVEKTPKDVYRGISKATNIPKEEIAMIGGVESQHGKYLDNMLGSSAEGLMQLMPATAEAFVPGSSKSIRDMNTQQEVVSNILNTNDPSIRKIKQDNDIVDKYLMYNLGSGSGRKFLSADDSQKVSDVLPAKVIKANPKLYAGKTIGETKVALREFLKSRGEEANFYPELQDILKGK